MKKKDIIFSLLLLVSSFLLVADLFFNTGQPATFDGTTHITNIAQFFYGLKDGDFPVSWAFGFANYGMPIPIIAQQLTSYLGAVINFLVHDVVLSYNVTLLIGAFLSTYFFYIFLRLYFSEEASFIGAFLLNFSSYRIINIYIRGAIPEFFTAVFFPLLLIGTFLLIKKKNITGFFLLIISSALLILTHPFIFVVAGFFLLPYVLYLLKDEKQKIKLFVFFLLSFVLGVLLTGYYILPLFGEIKYFYYGDGSNRLVPNQYLSFVNYLSPNWYYYYNNDIFVRGNFIKFGIVETTIIVISIGYAIYQYIKKKKVDGFLITSIITAVILIFFTMSLSNHYRT